MAYPAWNEGEEFDCQCVFVEYGGLVWSPGERKRRGLPGISGVSEADKLWCTEAQQIPFKFHSESCAEFIGTPDNEFMITTSDIYANSALVFFRLLSDHRLRT